MQIFLLAVLLFSMNANAEKPFDVGQWDGVFQDAARNRKLQTHVWYPVNAGTKLSPPSKSGPFLPILVAKDAALSKSEASYPLVLLSHGSGGTAAKLFWLAEHLVKNGIIVLGVDHPGNMTGDNSAEGMMKVWDRALDFRFALDEILKSPIFGVHIDQTRIGSAGHSAGGTTALLLAGARFSADRFTSPTPNCAGSDDPYYAKLCEGLKAIDFHSYLKKVLEADYGDPRIKAIVALDPGFARSFQQDSLKHLNGKAMVLVAEKLREPADEIYSKDFIGLMSAKSSEVVPNSIHMTFLTACKPGIPMDDPELRSLCANNDQKIRIQREVSKKTLAFFTSAWSSKSK